MTKKHFIAAAKFISAEKDRATAKQMVNIILAMNDNENFDAKKFLAACGF